MDFLNPYVFELLYYIFFQLKEEMLILHPVKCAIIDNYRSQENDIILLSLVRSNAENRVGIMNVKSKIHVALSRAKKGLYIMGNMDCLTKSSELWVHIRKTLEENCAIGKKFFLLNTM